MELRGTWMVAALFPSQQQPCQRGQGESCHPFWTGLEDLRWLGLSNVDLIVAAKSSMDCDLREFGAVSSTNLPGILFSSDRRRI